jgi:regulatory protein
MTEVTALKTDSRHPAQVRVYLDGRLWRAIPVAAAVGLRVGMTLDSDDRRRLEDEAGEAAALERAGRLLAIRPRSEAELRQRLSRAGVAGETIDRVLQGLRERGAVDDGQFARTWVENRAAFRPRSAAMLRDELRRKGVAPGTIRAAVTEVDEAQAAAAAAGRAVRRWSGLEPAARRRKLYAFLQRRGFDNDTIRLALRRLEAGEVENEELA